MKLLLCGHVKMVVWMCVSYYWTRVQTFIVRAMYVAHIIASYYCSAVPILIVSDLELLSLFKLIKTNIVIYLWYSFCSILIMRLLYVSISFYFLAKYLLCGTKTIGGVVRRNESCLEGPFAAIFIFDRKRGWYKYAE
jgi:hypothetical protein